MGCIVLAGADANLLTLAQSVVASSVDPLFPASRLYDNRVSTFWRAADPPVTSVNITAHLERVLGGDFEAWAPAGPTGWTVSTSGTGVVAQDTVTFHGGLSSARLNRGTGTAKATQIRPARAGERLRLAWALQGGGAPVGVAIRVRDLHTSRFLSAAGAWVAEVAEVVTILAGGGGFQEGSLAFTVEAYSVARRSLVDLEVQVEQIGDAGDTWADDISLLPAVDFTSVHGHNLDALVVAELRASTDNFSASNVLIKTPAVNRHAFYQRVAADTFYRYWRLALAGANRSGPIWISEWWLGQGLALAREPRAGWEKRPTRRQVRNITPAGDRRTYSRNVISDRGLRLAFSFNSPAQAVEFEQEVVERTENGEEPLIIVPYYDETLAGEPAPTDLERTVVLGHIDPDWPLTLTTTRQSSADLVVAESAYPAADELA